MTNDTHGHRRSGGWVACIAQYSDASGIWLGDNRASDVWNSTYIGCDFMHGQCIYNTSYTPSKMQAQLGAERIISMILLMISDQ